MLFTARSDFRFGQGDRILFEHGGHRLHYGLRTRFVGRGLVVPGTKRLTILPASPACHRVQDPVYTSYSSRWSRRQKIVNAIGRVARLYAVDRKQSQRDPPDESNDSDILVSRLKRILETPGISDQDRKLVERNLARIMRARVDSAHS